MILRTRLGDAVQDADDRIRLSVMTAAAPGHRTGNIGEAARAPQQPANRRSVSGQQLMAPMSVARSVRCAEATCGDGRHSAKRIAQAVGTPER